MPIAAAELAVGDGVIARALLIFDQKGDLLVFDGGQLIAGDLVGLERGAGIFDGLRAQEAAHKVVTERGTQRCHNVYLSMRKFWFSCRWVQYTAGRAVCKIGVLRGLI